MSGLLHMRPTSHDVRGVPASKSGVEFHLLRVWQRGGKILERGGFPGRRKELPWDAAEQLQVRSMAEAACGSGRGDKQGVPVERTKAVK
eukprot:6597728-Pyramimonas_sp.AAC.1